MDPLDQNPYAAPATDELPRANNVRAFKYRYVNPEGREVGTWNKKGELGDDALVLDSSRIPVLAIQRAVVRLNRLMLAVATEREPTVIVIAIQSGPNKGRTVARQLKREIDQATSSLRAQARREALKSEGRGEVFRAERCPHCGSTIELTGFAPTPQVYCPYCESVATLRAEGPPDEAHYHVCDKCGFYSRPDVFVSTTIIFLINFVYWRSQQHFICHACMRGEAWKSILRNVWTLVGMPMASYRLLRAYFGGSARSATFSGLDTANQHARKRRHEQAEDLYQTVLSRLTHAAGIHHNRALARSMAGDWLGCLDAANAAWSDCANYTPVYRLALRALESQGRTAEAAALRTRWEK